MVQLTWFVLPCTILFVISLISFNYWLSLTMGFLSAFLIIGLFIKVSKIDNKRIDTTGLIEKIPSTDNMRSQT
jgi:hypothetical protein